MCSGIPPGRHRREANHRASATLPRRILSARGLQDAHRGEHREIRKVLVVNRVELVVFDQPQQMGKLERQNPSGFSRILSPSTKSFRSGTCARHCCREPGRRSGLRPPILSPACVPKKLHQRGTPFSTATLATFAAGSMPSTGTFRWTKYCKQVAVVAGHFDHEALLVQAEARRHLVAVVLGSASARNRSRKKNRRSR